MQTEDLLKKAKSGDKQAFLEWGRNVKPTIAKLAFQMGVTKEESRKFEREVFKQISGDIESLDSYNANRKILQAAVKKISIKHTHSHKHNSEYSLKFEEDEEIHTAIQKLALQEKTALVLYQFYNLSKMDIAVMLDLSEEKVASAIQKAKEELQENLRLESQEGIEKRLDLLGKSYSRLEFPEEEEDFPEEAADIAEPVAEPKKTEKQSVNKKTLAALAGASLFLSAVIGSSFLFNDQPAERQQTAAEEEENPTTVTKEMVKKWEAEYEKIRTDAPERLGMSVDTFEQLEFVKKADALKERTFSRENIKQLKDDPKRMQEQVDTLLLSIHTPRGMLDSVGNYKLLSSETSKFLEIYTDKTDQLMTIADGLLEEYQEELEMAEVNGQLAPEKLTHSREDYPEEIENLTANLREYTFQYMVHPNENRFRTIRDINKFYEIHPFDSDMLSMQYLDILRNTPHFDETGMLWPIEQLPYSVIMMTVFTSDPMADPTLKGKVEPQLLNAFNSLLKGDEHTDIFDREGVVKKEFQTAWKSLLQHDSNPVTFIMLPILDEFEKSGWTKSAHYDQLAYTDIMHAVDLEREGELAELLPNGDLEVESATLQLKDYDYNDIEELYKEFSAEHDLNILSGIEPVEIVKLYHYANKIEDVDTMWHLTADDELKPSLDEYKKRWKKREEITETWSQIEIYKENIHRQGRNVFLIAFGTPKEENLHQYNMNEMILVTEKDQIWLMQNRMDEFYIKEESNFEAFDLTIQNLYQDLLQSGSLDAIQYASPAEIAGTFLLALEKDDLKTLRLLVHEMDESIDDEEFKERWISSKQMPVYSEIGGISFRVDIYNMNDQSIRGSVDILNDTANMEYSHYLPMEKVDGFWMIADTFGY